MVSDDADLPFAKPRFRASGGSGGHRGLESIIYHLESEDFPRIRIGVGRTEEMDLRDYVLSNLSSNELKYLRDELFPYLEDALNIYIKEGYEEANQKINTFLPKII